MPTHSPPSPFTSLRPFTYSTLFLYDTRMKLFFWSKKKFLYMVHLSTHTLFISFSLLLAWFRSYAISPGSFSDSPASFYQIRTWMLWKLPGTRLFRVGWKKHLACLCFSTLNKKIEVKFERISLPEQGIEPGTPSLWVRCANHYTVWPCYETKKSWSLYITFRFLQYMQ